jgi:hypothetical protein
MPAASLKAADRFVSCKSAVTSAYYTAFTLENQSSVGAENRI